MHFDPHALDAVVADTAGSARKTLLHVDGCLPCRRAFVEHGGSEGVLSSRLAATRPRTRMLIALTSLAVVAGALAAVAPVRGAAASMLAAFEPHRVAAVPLTLDDLRSLRAMPDLSAYATTRDLVKSSQAEFHDSRAASAAARFAIREPSRAISGLRPLSYSVQSASEQLVTFNGAPRTRVLRNGAATTLPADVAGTTLRIDLNSVVVATYDTAAAAADKQRLNNALERARVFDEPQREHGQGHVFVTMRLFRPGAHSVILGHTSQPRDLGGLALVVAQMRVPRVSSSGASVQRLAAFMLERPGVSPRLAAAFRALGDLSTTLPIPVPIDQAYTQPVAVDGVQGVGLGDNTGIGAAVIWQKNGMLYAVFAPRAARDVLAIANSLG